MVEIKKTADPRIPSLTIDALNLWIEHGIPPGSFLRAVLHNDLYGACRFADADNERALPGLVDHLCYNAPAECWGSRDRYESWKARKQAQRRVTAIDPLAVAQMDEENRRRG